MVFGLKNATFTPAAALSGFATISPGLNMSTTVAGATFKGTASDSDGLEGLTASQFMRSDAATSTTGTVSVLNDTGIYFGADNDGRLNVSGTDVYVQNQTQDGDIIIRVNDGGVQTTAMTFDGATSNVTVNTNLAVTGTATAATATISGTATANAAVVTNAITVGSIVNGNADGVGDIGAAGGSFNTIFAKATSAEYADLAERFASDAIYAPGTVVELGGSEEITICVDDLSPSVFGVVSTQPAYTMNAGSGNNDTHPAIAMTGRVPVMTMGFVTKGDRLVSAGNGAARAATLDEVTAFNVIGRALADKTSDGLGTVEAIVKIS